MFSIKPSFTNSVRSKFRILVLAAALVFTFCNAKADGISGLQEELSAIIADANCVVSVEVISASKNDVLFSYNPEEKMIPASITKLVTSAVAFAKLGPSFQLQTIVYSDDSDIMDGVVNGNIYLKGYGDPDLNSSDIVYLAKQLKDIHIDEIKGNIIYDESYFDKEYYGLAGYYNGDTDKRWWPYVSALNLDKNGGGYDPAYAAGDLLASELMNLGITFTGIVTAGTTPIGSVKEIAKTSHSLEDVATYMNKVSNNHSAIALFKLLGAKEYGPPGSLENGTRVVIDFLTNIGVDRDGFEVLEGSGLTRFNYVTGTMMTKLLKYMYDQEELFDFFYNSLAIAGVDGTIERRMIGGEAERNVHAKTGTINSVTSLCGYAVSRDNELLIFYAVMNGFGGSNKPYRNMQDNICEVLCRFSRNSD